MEIDVCVLVHKKYVPLMFLRGYRAAELRVNILKYNIEMDVKYLEIMSTQTEIIWSIYNINYHHY